MQPAKREVSKEIKDKILELLSNGASQMSISKQVGICIPSIRKFIETGKGPFTRCAYTKDETFFEEINTPEKAYWLGWLASDGCLNDSTASFAIALHPRDEEALVLLNNLIKSDRPIMKYVSTLGHPLSKLFFSGKKIYKDLLQHGMSQNKTKTVFLPPSLPSHLFKFYLRGYFEGDGNITIDKEGAVTSICGQSERIFNEIKEMIFLQTGLTANLKRKVTYNKGHESFIFILRFRGTRSSLGFLSWLYSERDDLVLKRKYESFLEILKNYRSLDLGYRYPVRQLSLDGKLIKEWENIKNASKTLGLSWATISRICKGRFKEVYDGYLWEYGDIVSAGFLLRKAY